MTYMTQYSITIPAAIHRTPAIDQSPGGPGAINEDLLFGWSLVGHHRNFFRDITRPSAVDEIEELRSTGCYFSRDCFSPCGFGYFNVVQKHRAVACNRYDQHRGEIEPID